MKKLALTIVIVFMAFAANAQRVGYDYDYAIDSRDYYDNILEDYGDNHRIRSYGDNHYVGSHYYNDDENEDIFTKIGLVGSRSASYATDDYGYGGSGRRIGGGLLGFGPQREGVFNGGGLFSPNIPTHGTTEDTDAPIGNGVLLLVGFGAAYALSKKNRK